MVNLRTTTQECNTVCKKRLSQDVREGYKRAT